MLKDYIKKSKPGEITPVNIKLLSKCDNIDTCLNRIDVELNKICHSLFGDPLNKLLFDHNVLNMEETLDSFYKRLCEIQTTCYNIGLAIGVDSAGYREAHKNDLKSNPPLQNIIDIDCSNSDKTAV